MWKLQPLPLINEVSAECLPVINCTHYSNKAILRLSNNYAYIKKEVLKDS